MKKLLIILIISTALTSCGDSDLDQCIDSKVEQGMSASDAREECEEDGADSQIRRWIWPKYNLIWIWKWVHDLFDDDYTT